MGHRICNQQILEAAEERIVMSLVFHDAGAATASEPGKQQATCMCSSNQQAIQQQQAWDRCGHISNFVAGISCQLSYRKPVDQMKRLRSKPSLAYLDTTGNLFPGTLVSRFLSLSC